MIYLNGKQIVLTKFPNGEMKIDADDIVEKLTYRKEEFLTLQYENDSDLITLMLVKKYLDTLFLESGVILNIRYMPYSRMDRTEGQTVFTLKYVTEFINSLNFKSVEISEPHSDVCLALVDRSRPKSVSCSLAEKIIQDVGFNPEKDYIYYPDASAEKHFHKYLYNKKSLTGLKHRDFKSGNITKLDIMGEIPKETGFKVIMVDDLCSKGTSFIKGAEKLKEMGAGEIYVAVAHCEETIFEGEILNTDLISKVYTTDSMIRSKTHEKIIEFKM